MTHRVKQGQVRNGRLVRMLVFWLLALMFSGCTGSRPPESVRPEETGSGEHTVSTSGFPIVSGKIHLRMMGARSAQHGPWDKMLVFTEYQKMTGIDVTFDITDQGAWRDKMVMVLASGDQIPDAFIRSRMTPNDLSRYGGDGLLVPLEGLINTYAPNLRNLLEAYPDVRKGVTAQDGHIYSLPQILTTDTQRTGLKPWMNSIWMEKLGLKSPETPEDLVRVLKAFRDGDPNGNGVRDEIPLTLSNPDFLTAVAGSWFGVGEFFGGRFMLENGSVRSSLTSTRYRDSLMFLHRLYKEGLLDPDIFSHTQAQFYSKLDPSRTGMFFIVADDVWSRYSKDYTGVAPLKGPYGDQTVNPVSPRANDVGTFQITRSNRYPEATMRWIDYFYSDEGSVFFRMGVEGKTYTRNADGSLAYLPEIVNDPRGISTAIGQFTIWPGGGVPHWANDKNAVGVNSPATLAAQKILQPYMPDTDPLPAPIFDKDTYASIARPMEDVNLFHSECRAMFVKGQMGFDQWDTYVDTLNKLGLKDIETAHNEAYQRNISR